MVDALRETCRVLNEGGVLVDLRPMSSVYPIEAVTADGALQIGEAEGTGMAEDDAAADLSMQRVVEDGLFRPTGGTRFDFFTYWRTPDEIASALQGSERIPRLSPTLGEMQRIWDEAGRSGGAPTGVRCRLPMTLGVYEKI